MGRSIRLESAVLTALVAAILLVPALSDAQPVQPTTPSQFKTKPEWYASSENRTAILPFQLPAEPAIPAGCTKPTKAQCVDGGPRPEGYWSTNACAAAPANDPRSKAMKAHCTWQMEKAWVATQATARPTVFPTTNPTTAFPALAPGRRIDNGKTVPFTTLPTGATKRGYSRTASPTKAATATAAPRGGTFTPRLARNVTSSAGVAANGAGGTYASQQMASVVGVQAQVDNGLTSALEWGAAAPSVGSQKAAQINEWVMAKPAFVGPGAPVNSCREYGFKRWGNWSSFQYAAKKMNRWYRNIYKIAMDPESPVFINQDLKQIGTNERIPVSLRDALPGEKLWRQNGADGTGPGRAAWNKNATDKEYNDPYIPPNAFYSISPDWLGSAAKSNHAKLGISQADATAIRQAYSSRSGQRIKAKNGFNAADPLAMHREAKVRLDTVYGNPLDEELTDITKRTSAYLELASRRVALLEKDACTVPSDPCYLCHPRPPIPPGIQEKIKQGLGRPAGIQKILEQVSGASVINPNPVDMTTLFDTGSPFENANALNAFNLAAGGLSELSMSLGRGELGGNASVPQGGALKQKGIDVLGQVAKPSGGVSGPATTVFQACVQEMMLIKPFLAATIDKHEKDLTAIVLNEVKSPKGCLQNPGPNNTNMCDWNYEYFAALVTDAFGDRIERDIASCSASVGNSNTAANASSSASAFATVKSSGKQPLVYPCVQRRDFSTSAPEVTKFLGVSGSATGEQCEVERQTRAIKDIQSQFADYFRGLEWDGGSGRVRDTESNAFEMGDADALGAKFDYATSWELQRTKTQGNTNDTMKGCAFEGAASQTASAKINFFGAAHELMYTDGAVKARSNPGRLKHQARWKDLDSGEQKYLKPPSANDGLIDRALGDAETVGRFLPPIYLADVEHTFWIVIGEFPVKITFGFSASAGMYFGFAGRSGDNCADPALKAPTNFRLTLGAYPYVQADAFADASVNYVVASAGVRLDLRLLKFTLPIGVDISHGVQDSWTFRAGGRIGIDMLSGSLSAYVSVGGPVPLAPEVTFRAQLMDWDGYHENFPLWGIERSVPSGAVRALLAKFPDLGNVSCQEDTASNTACSLLTQPNSQTAPCPGGGCSGGVPEYKKVAGKPDWHLCRFNEYDRNRLTQYKDACKDYTR